MAIEGKIVFSAGRPGSCDIWVLDLHNRELRRLTHSTDLCEMPKWSPDGSLIAYISHASGAPALWLMQEDGSEQRQLTHEKTYHGYPSWTSDGRGLVFCAHSDNTGELGIWQLEVESAKRELLVKAPGVPTHPMLSSDGSCLVVSAPHGGDYNIWEYRLKTGKWRALTDGPQEDFAPSYSPDEQLIAFVSSRNPSDPAHEMGYGVWLMNRDGTNQRRVSRDPDQDKHVSWAPDGLHLVYCASRPGTKRERLKVVNLMHDAAHTLQFRRDMIRDVVRQKDHEAATENPGLLSLLGMFPDTLQKMLYDASHFGTESQPHWKE